MQFDTLQQELHGLSARGLRREWSRVDGLDGCRILVNGRWRIHLCSNSYLGLHRHPKVVAAAQEAMARYGTGAGSARLLGGTCDLHEELEERLAAFKQAEAALLFPTGAMANLGIVTALVGPKDLVVGDRLNHASIVDACRLSGATFRVAPHRDVERLGEILERRRGRYRRLLVITEGLFSMDGDIAPLPEILELTRRYEGWLLVDDAHATGVLGSEGRGSLEHFGISPEGILQMGTLSKALGSLGGFIAGPREVIEVLKNKARSFIYTTSLPPACAAAALAALRLLQGEPQLRRRLWENVATWTQGLAEAGLELISKGSPIIPIRVGDVGETMQLAQGLFEEGVYAPGIRPPTVPAGSARIRTSVTTLHTAADLKEALEAFCRVIASPEGAKQSRFKIGIASSALRASSQ